MRVEVDWEFHREATAVKPLKRLVVPASLPPMFWTVPDVFNKRLAQGLGTVKSVNFGTPLRPVARNEGVP